LKQNCTSQNIQPTHLSFQDRLLMLYLPALFRLTSEYSTTWKVLQKQGSLWLERNTPAYGLCCSRFMGGKQKYHSYKRRGDVDGQV